jgi:hypothetical protein
MIETVERRLLRRRDISCCGWLGRLPVTLATGSRSTLEHLWRCEECLRDVGGRCDKEAQKDAADGEREQRCEGARGKR